MFILVENGEVYAPERHGPASVLLAGERVLKVGDVDRRALDRLGVQVALQPPDGTRRPLSLFDAGGHGYPFEIIGSDK